MLKCVFTEKAIEENAIDDLAEELSNMSPTPPSNRVEICQKTSTSFFQSLIQMARQVNKHYMMSGMIESFCKDVIMCKISDVSVTAVEKTCRRASNLFLNIDPTKMGEATLQKRMEFCNIVGSVEIGGSSKEEIYECPQDVLHRKSEENIERGIKLAHAGNHPSAAMKGEDGVHVDWKLGMQQHGRVSKEDRQEWSKYVESRD